ncbi:MAG: Methyltransferase type 11 [Chitinophagaceae bacterium]|nr:Methyltransferase type 11 [Chitinophagaceae bacterium]
MLRYFFIIILFCASTPILKAQKKTKKEKIAFCGVMIPDKKMLEEYYKPQLDFLGLHENDSIADIGAGSGWYEGALSAISSFNHLNFTLVDIDSGCLNRIKLQNMVRYYSATKGSPINHNFTIVNNTTDSLWLPGNSYCHIWIMNTLHEIDNKNKLLQDAAMVLKKNGELVILEMVPVKENQLHGGCNKPLLSLAAWIKLFKENGLTYKEHVVLNTQTRTPIQMIRFIKE